MPKRRALPHGVLYLIHFARPYPAGRRPQHYLGFSRRKGELEKRLQEHVSGRGAALMRAVVSQRIAFRVVAIWEGTVLDERRLHRVRNLPRYCPECERPGRRTMSPPGLQPVLAWEEWCWNPPSESSSSASTPSSTSGLRTLSFSEANV